MRKKGIKAEEYHEFDQFEDPEQIEFVDEDSLDLDSDDYEIINEEPNEDDLSTTDLLADAEDESMEEKTPSSKNKTMKIFNIIFYVLIILMLMITIDIISVARYNKGPYFAVKTATLKDGGTKVYYGIGYKVIKYHQSQGRRDIELGSWSMPYNIEPTDVQALDLAIAYKNDALKTYQKYNKKFLRISGDFQNYDKSKNELTFGYIDPDGAYTLNIICKMSKDAEVKEFTENQEITIIGTANDYKQKDDTNPNTLYINDCFAE